MKPFTRLVLGTVLLVTVLIISCSNLTYDASIIASRSVSQTYQYRPIHNRDGIGKFYQNREIAKVMGHQEFLWLERPSRESSEKPSQVINALNLAPTDVVADLGAGSGYFTFRLAPLVPQGKVLAVDIQPEMLEVIDFLKAENHIDNVETVLGTTRNPNLSNRKLNLALMVDAYHEFEYPKEMMERVVHALKEGGRVVLVEYRRENPFIPIKTLHKMTENQIKKEMAAVGLVWETTLDNLPQQHLIFFRKSHTEPR